MKRYIKASSNSQYKGSDFTVGDRINITKYDNHTTDIIGEIVAIKGDVISVLDLFDEDNTVYSIDLTTTPVELEVYMTAEQYRQLNHTDISVSDIDTYSTEFHQIIETDKWWDPEGLDTPEDSGRVIFDGSIEKCGRWLESKYNNAKRDRDIAVRSYTPNEYLELYYFNSQSKVCYTIK